MKMVWGCARRIAGSRRNRPRSTDEALARLEASGPIESMAMLRAG
ncbi:hypothetical protein [Glycomyces sp. L485]|nr:hypothetical protein [Glycomyces sp. L485]